MLTMLQGGRQHACVRSLYAAGASSITRRSASHTMPCIARTKSSCAHTLTRSQPSLQHQTCQALAVATARKYTVCRSCPGSVRHAPCSIHMQLLTRRTGLISALARVRLILRPAPCEHEFHDFGSPLPRTTNDQCLCPSTCKMCHCMHTSMAASSHQGVCMVKADSDHDCAFCCSEARKWPRLSSTL